jgi:hypothetical protein
VLRGAGTTLRRICTAMTSDIKAAGVLREAAVCLPQAASVWSNIGLAGIAQRYQADEMARDKRS